MFLVDLDLTTVNRTIRSTTANRHKRLNDISDKPSSNKRRKVNTKDDQTNTPTQSTSVLQDDANIENVRQQRSLQILDLHTSNPIVSYGGQVFSCSWTDMIGTTMFFGQPRETAFYEAELQTSDFDMIGTSRIKLVGTAAKVTPIPQNGKESKQTDTPARPGQSLGTIRRTNAKLNADLRKQASFLEQLMNIKKNRGEQDNVYVAMNGSISKAVAAGKAKTNIQGRNKEIEELNRKAVKGDAEALQKIEQIYLGQDGDDSGDDVQTTMENDNAAADTSRLEPQPEEVESDEEYDRPRIIGTASPSPDM